MSDYALRLSGAELGRYRMMAEHAQRREHEQWRAAGVVPGAEVADIGCGPGAVAVLLARTVGSQGHVHAVDADPEAVAAARRTTEAAGVANVDVRVGQASDPGLPEGSLDVAMLRHVLAHNGGQEQAIVDRLAGLVRRDGCVYLVDIDASSMREYPQAPAVVTEMFERYWEFQSGRGNDLAVGLRLGELLEKAGLELVDHGGYIVGFKPPPGLRPPAWAAREQMLAAGVVDEADLARWADAFEEWDRAPNVSRMFMPTYVAYGRRP